MAKKCEELRKAIEAELCESLHDRGDRYVTVGGKEVEFSWRNGVVNKNGHCFIVQVVEVTHMKDALTK